MEDKCSHLGKALSFSALLLLQACGGSSSSDGSSSNDSSDSPTSSDVPPSTQQPPSNDGPILEKVVSEHYFRDVDSDTDEISGQLVLKQTNDVSTQVASAWFYWANLAGDKVGDAWLKATALDHQIMIPENTAYLNENNFFWLYPFNQEGIELTPVKIKFHDFIGNALMSGPGGINDFISNPPDAGDKVTADGAWYYGGLSEHDREKISVQRTDLAGGTCIFDNGLVAVSDMANQKDAHWEANSHNGEANVLNEVDYPAFSFLCDETNPVNLSFEVPRVKDDFGAWTYSPLNDTMFYGTKIYDAYLKLLGEPALEDKLRFRAHYGPERNPTFNDTAYWDGVYANLNGNLDVSKMTTLDIMAHEIAHGILSRISSLKAFNNELSKDARTLHEAFADISGVLVKYDYTGELNWNHNEESRSSIRKLDQIVTESGAIESFLDYEDAGQFANENPYKRIGMISYPFYLLTQKWGVEKAYSVIIEAARNCWANESTLPHAANCIKQAAGDLSLSETDVEDAFKAVKIKLFDMGVISHFESEVAGTTASFTNTSQSTGEVLTWLWDFGDDETSSVENPVHTYNQAGTYQVTLRVTDSNNDQDTIKRSITVANE